MRICARSPTGRPRRNSRRLPDKWRPLDEEAVKALTGESQLDLGVINGMLLKHRARLEECKRTMEEAKAKKEAEAENTKAAKAQVKEMLTWVERYDKASVEAKHMIIAALVDRIEIGENY